MASLNSTLSAAGDMAKRARTNSIAGGGGAAAQTSKADAAADLLAALNSTLFGTANTSKRPASSSIGAGAVAATRNSTGEVAADLLADLNSTLSGAVEGPMRASSGSFAPASRPPAPSTARQSEQAHAQASGARRLSQNPARAAAASARTSMLVPGSIRSSVSTGGSELAAIDAVLQGGPSAQRRMHRAADAHYGSVSTGVSELAQDEAVMEQDRRASAMPQAAAPGRSSSSMRRTAEVQGGLAGGDELVQINAMMQRHSTASALPKAVIWSARPTAEPEPSRGSMRSAADAQHAPRVGGAELAAISAVLQRESERRGSAALQPGTRQASPRSTSTFGGGELAQIGALSQQVRKTPPLPPAPAAVVQRSARDPTITPVLPSGLESLLADAAEAASASRQRGSPARQHSTLVPKQTLDHVRQHPSVADPSVEGQEPPSTLQSRHPTASVHPHRAAVVLHAPTSHMRQYAHMLQPEFVSPPFLARMLTKLQQEPQLPASLIITAQHGCAWDRIAPASVQMACGVSSGLAACKCRFEQGARLLSAALGAWDRMEQDGHATFMSALQRKVGVEMMLTVK